MKQSSILSAKFDCPGSGRQNISLSKIVKLRLPYYKHCRKRLENPISIVSMEMSVGWKYSGNKMCKEVQTEWKTTPLAKVSTKINAEASLIVQWPRNIRC